MGWADSYIEKLKQGESVTFRPRGNSMSPRIKSGDQVLVVPICGPIEVGAVVLCKVKGRQYLHLVKQVSDKGYLIGNNKGHINGWTKEIYGILEPISELSREVRISIIKTIIKRPKTKPASQGADGTFKKTTNKLTFAGRIIL